VCIVIALVFGRFEFLRRQGLFWLFSFLGRSGSRGIPELVGSPVEDFDGPTMGAGQLAAPDGDDQSVVIVPPRRESIGGGKMRALSSRFS
jgi:hypothetical protein